MRIKIKFFIVPPMKINLATSVWERNILRNDEISLVKSLFLFPARQMFLFIIKLANNIEQSQ